MKLSISAAAFSDAAAWANRARSPRPNLPILTGLLLEANQDQIRVSGFDYETAARAIVPGESDVPFRAVIPGSVLTEILGKLSRKNGRVDLEIQGSRAILNSGKATFNLSLMPEGQYPALPDMPPQIATIDGDEFATALGRARFAASRDHTLPVLAAVNFVGEPGELTLESTDRYRMSLAGVPWNLEGAPGAWLVDVSTVDTVTRLAAGEMQVFADDSTIGFQSGNRVLTSTLRDGDYPKIRGLFPTSTPYEVLVDRDAFKTAVELASIVAERGTPIRLTIDDAEMQLDAGTGEDSQAAEYVDVQVIGADKPLVVAFNPHYLSEALQSMPDGEVIMRVQDKMSKPVVFDSSDQTVEYRHIVMPVRIPGK